MYFSYCIFVLSFLSGLAVFQLFILCNPFPICLGTKK
jgi:hypothetical protein